MVLVGGLVTAPSRRTFDRRPKIISTTDIKDKIATMGYLFVREGYGVNSSVTAINSTLLKAKGSVWHKSSMKK